MVLEFVLLAVLAVYVTGVAGLFGYAIDLPHHPEYGPTPKWMSFLLAVGWPFLLWEMWYEAHKAKERKQ